MGSYQAWWDAKNALMTKPAGPEYLTCTGCRGEGCRDCRGWGWHIHPDACELPATGRPCNSCAAKRWCKR